MQSFSQGTFQLYYRIVTISSGQEVDSGQQTLAQPIQDRTSALTVTGSSSISGARTTLFLSGGPQVVCREGYFGPNCGCSPRDDGNCCSPTEGGDSCPTACDTVINVCFREAQHPVNDNNPAVCPLGTVTVSIFAPGAGIPTLTATEQAATTTYPVSLINDIF